MAAIPAPFLELANLFLPTIFANETANKIADRIPDVPDPRQWAPRGGGPNDRTLRKTPVSANVTKNLGIKDFPNQPGPDFVTNQLLEDEARGFQEMKDQRMNEDAALRGFSFAHNASMDRFRGTIDEQFSNALDLGNKQFGDAVANVRARYGEQDTAVVGTLKALGDSIKDVKQQRAEALTEMSTARGEYLGRLEEETSAMASKQITVMFARGVMELQDLENAMMAEGTIRSQVQTQKHMMRMGLSQDIGDTVLAFREERAESNSQKELALLQDENAFRNNIGQVLATMTGQVGVEAGAALGRWADGKAAVAQVEARLASDFASWRSTIANNWTLAEGMVREAEMAGRTQMAEMARNLTIPSFRLAHIADARLAYNTMEEYKIFEDELRITGIHAGLDMLPFTTAVNSLQSALDYSLAQDQIESQEKMQESANDAAITGSLIGAGGTALGGFLGRPK